MSTKVIAMRITELRIRIAELESDVEFNFGHGRPARSSELDATLKLLQARERRVGALR